MDDFKTFLISYQHQGSTWGAEVLATNSEDARARIRAIGTTGVVDGQLIANIPASLGFWVPLWCWFRNIWVRS
jgi:hypothetical protein